MTNSSKDLINELYENILIQETTNALLNNAAKEIKRLSEYLLSSVYVLANNGHKIEAVRNYRAVTGSSLKECLKYVEKLIEY